MNTQCAVSKHSSNIESINVELVEIKNKLADLTNNLEHLAKSSYGAGGHIEPTRAKLSEVSGITKAHGDVISQSRADKLVQNGDRDFRDAVLLTVHSELKSINRRSSEVVVTGLPPRAGVTDDELFRDMCFSNLSISIPVIKTQRLGKDVGKIRPLMVAFDNHETASKH